MVHNIENIENIEKLAKTGLGQRIVQ